MIVMRRRDAADRLRIDAAVLPIPPWSIRLRVGDEDVICIRIGLRRARSICRQIRAQEVRALREKVGVTETARQIGISRSTVYRLLEVA